MDWRGWGGTKSTVGLGPRLRALGYGPPVQPYGLMEGVRNRSGVPHNNACHGKCFQGILIRLKAELKAHGFPKRCDMVGVKNWSKLSENIACILGKFLAPQEMITNVSQLRNWPSLGKRPGPWLFKAWLGWCRTDKIVPLELLSNNIKRKIMVEL